MLALGRNDSSRKIAWLILDSGGAPNIKCLSCSMRVSFVDLADGVACLGGGVVVTTRSEPGWEKETNEGLDPTMSRAAEGDEGVRKKKKRGAMLNRLRGQGLAAFRGQAREDLLQDVNMRSDGPIKLAT